MTIGAFLNYISEIKPHAFSEGTVLAWLNEVEGVVATDTLLFPEGPPAYVRFSERRGGGVAFPDSATMTLPEPLAVCPGGVVTVANAVTYAANNGAYRLKAAADDGKTLRFDAGTFAATGDAPEAAADLRISFDGDDVELLLGEPHQRLYGAYVAAMIDFANGEYGKYQNDMALFNAFWECFSRWYAQNRRPADVKEGGGDLRELYRRG